MARVHALLSGLLLLLLVEDIIATKTAFVIVDVQTCFLPGGTLAVPLGNGVIKPINKILENVQFELVVRSQDWHCKNHVSFASQHKGLNNFTVIPLNYTSTGDICGNYSYKKTKKTCSAAEVKYKVNQTLWPDHCVINTTDAELVSTLKVPSNAVTVRKGYHCEVDSYSAFYDNGRFSHTELNNVLQKRNITRVYFAGLATDFCVSWTAKDAKKLGYDSYVIVDASAYIKKESFEQEKIQWKALGVKITDTDTVIRTMNGAGYLNTPNAILLLLLLQLTITLVLSQ